MNLQEFMLECRRVKVLFDFFYDKKDLCEEILKSRGKWKDEDNEHYDESKKNQDESNKSNVRVFGTILRGRIVLV